MPSTPPFFGLTMTQSLCMEATVMSVMSALIAAGFSRKVSGWMRSAS